MKGHLHHPSQYALKHNRKHFKHFSGLLSNIQTSQIKRTPHWIEMVVTRPQRIELGLHWMKGLALRERSQATVRRIQEEQVKQQCTWAVIKTTKQNLASRSISVVHESLRVGEG